MSPLAVPAGLAGFDPSALGDTFKDDVWLDIPHREEFRALGASRLIRRHVFDAYRADTAKGVVWTIVWGYPRGKISKYDGDKADAHRAIAHAPHFADVIAEIRAGPILPARKLIAKLNSVSTGVSTSTTSKIAYFAGLCSQEGQCLIFDKQVIKAVAQSKDPALASLRGALTPANVQPATSDKWIAEVTGKQGQFYGGYLAAVNNLSFRLGKRYPRDLIEQFLFAKGRGII